MCDYNFQLHTKRIRDQNITSQNHFLMFDAWLNKSDNRPNRNYKFKWELEFILHMITENKIIQYEA